MFFIFVLQDNRKAAVDDGSIYQLSGEERGLHLHPLDVGVIDLRRSRNGDFLDVLFGDDRLIHRGNDLINGMLEDRSVVHVLKREVGVAIKSRDGSPTDRGVHRAVVCRGHVEDLPRRSDDLILLRCQVLGLVVKILRLVERKRLLLDPVGKQSDHPNKMILEEMVEELPESHHVGGDERRMDVDRITLLGDVGEEVGLETKSSIFREKSVDVRGLLQLDEGLSEDAGNEERREGS